MDGGKKEGKNLDLTQKLSKFKFHFLSISFCSSQTKHTRTKDNFTQSSIYFCSTIRKPKKEYPLFYTILS